MNRVSWWLVEQLAELLDAEERETVLGDLAEFSDEGGVALLEITGLVARRQAAFWRSWRPRLVLAGLVVPLGVLLSLAARGMADGSAISIWFFANNWDWHLIANAGFWYGFAESVPAIFMASLALMCWSWTSGFLVASLAPRAFRCHGVLFCLLLLGVGRLGLPHAFGQYVLLGRARDFSGNAAVFAVGFYRLLFPLVVQLILVVMPLLWGMRRRFRLGGLPLLNRLLLWGMAVVTVFALAAESSVWWQVRTWAVYPPRLPLLPSLLPFAVLGPVGYWLAIAGLKARRTASLS